MEVEYEEVKPKVEAAVEVKKEVHDHVESFKEGANNNSNFGPVSGPDDTPASDQLTIFYGGTVLVFDAIPAEKACEIILIAAAAAAAVKPADAKNSVPGTPACGTPVLTRSPSLQSATNALPSPPAKFGSSLCKLQAELPIARRHSLQRFFEKRRDRLCSRNPYLTSATKKFETTKPDFSAEVSPEAGCFGKPLAMEKEIQPKAAATLLE